MQIVSGWPLGIEWPKLGISGEGKTASLCLTSSYLPAVLCHWFPAPISICLLVSQLFWGLLREGNGCSIMNVTSLSSLEKTSQMTLWTSDSYYPPFSNVSGDIRTGAAYQGIVFVAVVINLLISFESEISSRTEQKWYRWLMLIWIKSCSLQFGLD